MKKLAFALFAAFVVLASGVAEAGGGHGGGGHGGHGYYGGHGGYHGGGWGGGYYRGGWGWGWGGPRVVIGGPGFWWGSPYRYYGGYPYGYPYAAPYAAPYYAPQVVQPPEPQVYVQQTQPAQQYWYYCEDPKGYYPYVNQCHGEWLQVVPRGDAPQ